MNLQQEFETLAAEIVANGRKKYASYSIPAFKLESIQEMGEQLKALKAAYAMVFDTMNIEVPSLE